MKQVAYDRKYINIKDLFYYLKKRMIFILAGIAFCSIFFASINMVSQIKNISEKKKLYPDGVKTVTITLGDTGKAAAQLYLGDKAIADNLVRYNDESIFMKLNPDGYYRNDAVINFETTSTVDTATLVASAVEILSGEDLYRYMAIQYGYASDDFAYFKEMVALDASNPNELKIIVNAPDEESLTNYLGLINTYLSGEFTNRLTDLYGELTVDFVKGENYVYADAAVRDTQHANLTNASAYTSSLDTQWAGMKTKVKKYIKNYLKLVEEGQQINPGDPITYTQSIDKPSFGKKNFVKAGIKGFIIGAVGMIGIFIFVYTFTPFIWGGRSVEESFGLSSLGTLGKDDKMIVFKINSVINACHENENRKKWLVISSSIKEDSKEYDELEELFMKVNAEDGGIVSFEDLISDRNGVKLCDNAVAIIMAEKVGKATYKEFATTIDALKEYSGQLTGFIEVKNEKETEKTTDLY